MSGPGATPALLAAGAVKSAVEALLRRPSLWEGEPPRADFGTVGALRDRVLAGESPAVVVLSEEAIAALAGRLVPGTVMPLGRTGIGLALRAGGVPRPIGTGPELREALLVAASVGWADAARGATAGRHFERVIAELAIAEVVRAKGRVFGFGVEAVAACGRGEVELAVSQATEILGQPGVSLLGEFPPPFDLGTRYAAAALAEGPEARAILAVLAGPEAGRALRGIGFTN
ncbi:molybdate ABC transporter substrate-binding protein [Roseomonas sp. BN140053]|uniref:molybdate ABC transporter substrate-binding protein n=1 Tax=Roseomonas sp. BN140053 TaxID=3391898 RepID=UPI0039E7FADD